MPWVHAQDICLVDAEDLLTLQVSVPSQTKSTKPIHLGTWELTRRPGDAVKAEAYIKVYYSYKADAGPAFQVLFDYRNNHDYGLPFSFQRAALIQENTKSLDYSVKDFQKGDCESVGRSIFPGQYFSENFPISLDSKQNTYVIRIWGSQN